MSTASTSIPSASPGNAGRRRFVTRGGKALDFTAIGFGSAPLGNYLRPLSEEELEFMENGAYIHAQTQPGSDRPRLNKGNDYLIDRELQRSGASFTGIWGIGMQDSAVQESMGSLYDRRQEHLGSSDSFIVTIRLQLLQVLKDMERGETPPGLDPATHHLRAAGFIGPSHLPFEEAIAPYVTGTRVALV